MKSKRGQVELCFNIYSKNQRSNQFATILNQKLYKRLKICKILDTDKKHANYTEKTEGKCSKQRTYSKQWK